MSKHSALEAWEVNAKFWDAGMGAEGNDYYQHVELPALTRMIEVKQGERALDLATGNGLVARWLATAGARVVATDGSKAMLEQAKKRGEELKATVAEGKVEYRLLDVTDLKMWEEFIELETAGGGAFDIIVMNMAIMDVPTLEPLAAALPRLLKKGGGRFVATILHPFMTLSGTRVVEYTEKPETGVDEENPFLKVKQYLDVPPVCSVALQGQPVPQSVAVARAAKFYFHRPLHKLFAPFFGAGLALDAIEEPNFDEEYVLRNNISPESWRAWTQIPKILAFRMRRAAGKT